MGAKVQTENTKLKVPGAGAYEFKSKVSFHPEFYRTRSMIFDLKINFN